VLEEKGVPEDIARNIADIIGENKDLLVDIVKNLRIDELPSEPTKVAKITSIYYIVGATPAVVPFFIAYIFGISPFITVLIAILMASAISFIAGIFTAVLSGTNIKRKAITNALIIIGVTLTTFLIGLLVRRFLGIEV